MNNLYLPVEVNSNNCVYIYDKDTIRVYDSIPSYNNDITYTDYFVNSHYLSKNGVQRFNSYSTLPTCLDNSNIVNDYTYRFDFPQIVILFFFVCYFAFYLPFKIYKRLFRRFN